MLVGFLLNSRRCFRRKHKRVEEPILKKNFCSIKVKICPILGEEHGILHYEGLHGEEIHFMPSFCNNLRIGVITKQVLLGRVLVHQISYVHQEDAGTKHNPTPGTQNILPKLGTPSRIN